jgi:dTDP-4-amino-4,6-dideoxygalactose transaminase
MILMNDFKAESEELRQREMIAMERVLRSGWYILGSELDKFEASWAKQCGTLEAVGVANGMDALEIGLRALNICAGDEVITTPMTAFATILAIYRAGATPVLADIEPDTALLNMESVARCISSRTKAVLLVHLYGQAMVVDQWESFCKSHGLLLLEDCAQAHLAEWGGRVVGSFGSFGAYSFYPTKNLGAIGDAGALVTDNIEIANCARRLRNYGQSERYHHPEIGMNSRLDELQAAILSERLAWLASFIDARRHIADVYYRELANPRVKLLAKPEQSSSHVYHLFVVLCRERDSLSRFLTEAGVQSLSHYPLPVHWQPPCLSIKKDPRGLPTAEHHAKCCLSIPCHPQMTVNQIATVVEAVNAFK